MARYLRPRDAAGTQYDSIEEDEDGFPRVGFVSPQEAAKLALENSARIVSGDEWGQHAAKMTESAKRLFRRRDDSGTSYDAIQRGPDGQPRVAVVSPQQAAAETMAGRGKFVEPEEFGAAARSMTGPSSAAGQDVVVTALNKDGSPVRTTASMAEAQGLREVPEAEAARIGAEQEAARDPRLLPRQDYNDVGGSGAKDIDWSPTGRLPAADYNDAGGARSGDAAAARAAGGSAPLTAPASMSGLPPEVAAFRQQYLGETDAAPEPPRPVVVDIGAQVQRPLTPPGMSDLEKAHKEGAMLEFLARMGQSFDNAGRIIAGLPENTRQVPEGLRDRPVQELQARQKAEASARASDPRSEESKRAREMALTAAPDLFKPEDLEEYSANDLEPVMKVAELRSSIASRLEQKAAREEQLKIERARLDQQATIAEKEISAKKDAQQAQITAQAEADKRKYEDAEKDRRSKNWNEQQDRDQRAIIAGLELDDKKEARRAATLATQAKIDAKAAASKSKGGRTLPATEAAEISNADVALKSLAGVRAAFGPSGAASIKGVLATKMPWDTMADKFNDMVLASAQVVGTILEGGKLAAGDEVKYRKLFPAPGDSYSRAMEKVTNLENLVSLKKSSTIQGFGRAGYDVSGFAQQDPVQARSNRPSDIPADYALIRLKNGREVTVPNEKVEEFLGSNDGAEEVK